MEGRTEEGRTDSVFHDESQWKDSGAHLTTLLLAQYSIVGH